MRLPSSKDDIIVSFGIDGNLVKRVVAADDAIDEQPLLQITVSPIRKTPRASRLASNGEERTGVEKKNL